MIINIQGISENRIARAVASKTAEQGLVITTNAQRAARIATDLSFFSDANIYVLPDLDPALFKYEAKSRTDLDDYLNAYSALLSGEHAIVVAPVLSALKKLQPKEAFIKNTFEIHTGELVSRNELISRLTYMGYERVASVEAQGQFAARGDIIDVFSPSFANPVRIELFDDEIDSIRSFDSFTQRSVENMDSVAVFPSQLITIDDDVPEIASLLDEGTNAQYLENFVGRFYKSPDFIWNYMKAASGIFVDDPARIAETLDFFEAELVQEEGKTYPLAGDIKRINDFPTENGTFYFTPFAQQIRFAERQDKILSLNTRQAPVFSGHMEVLETELKRLVSDGYKVVIACGSLERYTNLKDFAARAGLDGKIELREGSLSSGTEYIDEKLLYLSETDIFRTAKHVRKTRSKGQKIKAFTDIKKGDYIVHEAHGVGRFTGVDRLTVDGSTRDYLRIQYAGADVLYVPVDQMETIQKYVGGEGTTPKISKLSGTDWQMTKAKAKTAIMDMAREFLKAQAQREIAQGYAFGPDSAWQKEFEDAFPYTETDDQLRCSEEIKQDMQQPIAMDRLLCGDVGYGKTEVAARGIFKALEAGKQVAVLVPTTILASQHYHTFLERFKGYPFVIDMLCRFRTDSQQDRIIKGLENGDVDLVVGTHRLISQDVKFKNLGLLVIDEEQRFGVEHKEKIKRMKANVDVLTLSATPIPRTLHMSLIGVRNMSVIEEPPEDRYPVQTYVLEQDDHLVAEAVRREIGRGGQVYLVYNRVRGIQQQARKLKDLIPEARISVAHGQMGERELEDVMLSFQDHEADVLVTTTIIESGLDIPNVNTLIVLNADYFGLSQLYQLRGRVGRSNRMAYAYLMYQKDKVLSETAEKRLRAIREFTEFGSGFRVAMRDLELRGAGNLLGTEQSGHMLSLGYELYCKLVAEAVAELKGEGEAEENGFDADTSVELGVSAFLPENYVADEIIRLDMYKKIASVYTDEDRIEIFDELLDRFGDPPQEVANLLDAAMIRNRASKLGVSKIVKQQDKAIVIFDEKNVLGPELYLKLMDKYGPSINLLGSEHPRLTLSLARGNTAPQILRLLEALKND